MGLGSVPAAERMHIAFFGLCNAGKSSLVNAFCSQPVSIVSEKKGTTTDPVVKTMELLPLGPVVIIDTPGIDDRTELGLLRIERAEKMLRRADIAILAKEAGTEMTEEEEKLLTTFREKEIPCIIAYTKSDLLDSVPPTGDGFIYVSAKEGMNINELKEMVGRIVKDKASRPLVEDLVEKGDVVVLVIPIDSSAPKGRLILPQQMMMRSLLDAGAIAVAVQPEELPSVLSFVRPRLVITDSQAFSTVSRMVPEDIPMTSFSILMARYKGELDVQLDGVSALGNLKKGDKVLIAEGCTHHRQCEDIGTVKIPKLVSSVAEGIEFEFSSGHGFPENLSEYSLIIHCGACMLTEKEMKSRIGLASDAGVPVTNYGMALAYFNGILSRALKPLGIDVHNDRR